MAFAYQDEVRKRFPDGVLWVTLGQNPSVTQRISDWVAHSTILRSHPPAMPTPSQEPTSFAPLGEVEYLPLAIELIGAQVHKLGWTEYRRRWEDQKLKAIRRGRRSRGKEDNLWDSLELSIQSLTDEDRGRYFSMGVFPEDTPFPQWHVQSCGLAQKMKPQIS